MDPASHRLNLWFPIPEDKAASGPDDRSSALGLKSDLAVDDVQKMYDGMGLDENEGEGGVREEYRKAIVMFRPTMDAKNQAAELEPEAGEPISSFDDSAFPNKPLLDDFDEDQGWEIVTYSHGPVAFVASLLPHAGMKLKLRWTDGDLSTVDVVDAREKENPVYSSEIRGIGYVEGVYPEPPIRTEVIPSIFRVATGIDAKKYVHDAAGVLTPAAKAAREVGGIIGFVGGFEVRSY